MRRQQYLTGEKTTPTQDFVVIAEHHLRSCLGMDELRKKNIALRLDIYEDLLDMKHGKDTFSDVIERLILNWKGKK
jgi:hypothetical protein